MESNSLDLKPEELYEKDAKQETNNITDEYGIDIFKSDEQIKIYNNETSEYIFSENNQVEIKLANEQIDNIYKNTVVYEPNVENSIIDQSSFLWEVIVFVQIFILIYFIYKVFAISQERRKNVKNNTDD